MTVQGMDMSHCDEITEDLAGLILEFRRTFKTSLPQWICLYAYSLNNESKG